eukprot:4382491-Prymnesium_polylepis.1
MMINWAECVAIGVVTADWSGSEWISFVGPTIASLVHACLFLSVPPSQAKGSFTPPLLRGLVGRGGAAPAEEAQRAASRTGESASST